MGRNLALVPELEGNLRPLPVHSCFSLERDPGPPNPSPAASDQKPPGRFAQGFLLFLEVKRQNSQGSEQDAKG